MIFSANSWSAYCWQTFISSFFSFLSSLGNGITAKPFSFNSCCISSDKLSFSNFIDPLKAPKSPFTLSPIISSTPHLPVTLTLPPNEGHLSTHMAHPLPYLVQFPIGPDEPVVSTKLSPSILSPSSKITAFSISPSQSTSTTLLIILTSIPISFISFLTGGSIFKTLYIVAWLWPGKFIFLCVAFSSVSLNNSVAPRHIASSQAVYLPLFLIIPPTFPRPINKSVFSRITTSAPAFDALIAAAHPAQPPPITTTFAI